MNTLTEKLEPASVPLMRKLLMLLFVVLCTTLGFVLSEWAIIEAIRGLTSGLWLYHSLDFQLIMILYALTGMVSAMAGLLWLLRAVLLLSRRAPIWEDRVQQRLFVAATVGFVLMNILHIGSEIILCRAGLPDLCTF